MLITVIGRGHSGTRVMSHTLTESGVYMGADLNKSGDLVPPEDLYEACRVMGKQVLHLGGVHWDFSNLNTAPIDPEFTRLVESYLASVLSSDCEAKGWKLPETTLILPWIVRMFPEARYIYWMRDPRDSILGDHLTDDLADFGVPYDKTHDLFEMRAISWQYQFEIMKKTPSPKHRIDVRFEDFVMQQPQSIARLNSFLGIELAQIPVRAESIGRWKADSSLQPIDFFPKEALYNGPPEVARS